MASFFLYHNKYDILARFLGVGIFAIENYNHLIGFESEVANIVSPALAPLPKPLCSIVHMITIGLGLGGSIMFMLAGLKRFSSFMSHSLKALLVFMVIITWNWWFRRNGEFIWNVADPLDYRNRTIHCLKNLSIFGLLLMNYRVTRSPPTKRS